MGDAARILATESMAEARAALADFAAEVDRILAGVDAEIHRTSQWLQSDRPAHWKRQVRAREDGVLRCKTEISRKQIIAAPEPASVVDERKRLAKAERRLDEARRRQEATHRWAVAFERDAMVYKGAAHLLREMVSGRIPAGLANISRMIESVEAYLSVAPPPGDPDAPPPDAGPSPNTPATGPLTP